MIYLDNAATSRFKPRAVIDAILYDIHHACNSGRSGHKDAIEASVKVESCREYLRRVFDAEEYDVIFTKSCTEALNLAILGSIKGGERALTTKNEHNSVLRPLFELKRREKISLDLIEQEEDCSISLEKLRERAKGADMIVASGASNVTGISLDIGELGKIARESGAILIVDGAQTVPYFDVKMQKMGIDMLALPAHKGLHGVQGVGVLIKRKDISLAPLVFGGTGTASSSVYQPTEPPECYEAGTQFAGGIAALKEGAMWSFAHRDETVQNNLKLTEQMLYNIKSIGLTAYSDKNACGIVAFNHLDTDSSLITQLLDADHIATRSGLHCAPLVHEKLDTLKQGAVRVSFGVESTGSDLLALSNSLEKIVRRLRM